MTPSVKISLQYTTIQEPTPDFIYDGLKSCTSKLNAYDPTSEEFVQRIAHLHGLSVDSILPVAGANEAIQLLAIANGANSFVFTPTYIEYIVVTSLKGKMTEVPSIRGDTFSISPEKLPDATLVFLANPNNPFGCTSREVIAELVQNNSDTIVVIDEAYAEFADLSVINLVSKYPNLVILRSFSKSYALASARIGYLVGAPDIVKVVKEKAPWSNVSRLAIGAALAALDHEEYYAKMRERLNNGRDELEVFLHKEGFDVFPSKINAVTVKFESADKACDFVLYLAENNIEVNQGNGVANMGLDDSFVRIAIGTEKQMIEVKKVIQRYE